MKQPTHVRNAPRGRVPLAGRLTSLGVFSAALMFAGCSDIEPDSTMKSPSMTTAGAGGKGASPSTAPVTAGGSSAQRPTPEPEPDREPVKPTPTPSQPKPDEDCSTCLDRTCQTEWDACQANMNCSNLVGCITECPDGDTECLQGCNEKFSAGRTLLDSFVECGNESCPVCGADAPEPADATAACTPDAPEAWTGGTVLTQAEVDACLEKCDDDACVEAMCEKGAEFIDCLGATDIECVGSPGGPCRSEYTAFWCCLDACNEKSADMDAFEACVDKECPTERDAWFDCREADSSCAASQREGCISGS